MLDYMLCSAPRTGSNLVSGLLNQTGQLGEPREFFNHGKLVPRFAAEVGIANADMAVADLDNYLKRVRERYQSPNGRFGIKIHFDQLHWATSNGFNLNRWLPSRVVYISRGDALSQAISLSRAFQTDVWETGAPQKGAPEFSPEHIFKCLSQVVVQAQCWEKFFQNTRIMPYRLTYESFVANMPQELGALLQYLRVDFSQPDLMRIIAQNEQKYRIQRDGLNVEWRQRYREWESLRGQARY